RHSLSESWRPSARQFSPETVFALIRLASPRQASLSEQY
ncbi:hypothetical protein L195_g029317, partial [Trifolium pratense]